MLIGVEAAQKQMIYKFPRRLVCIYLLFVLLESISITVAGQETQIEDVQSPIRELTVTIDASRNEEFFDLIRNFADKHGFAIRIVKISQIKEDYTIRMYREDYKIFGNNPWSSEEYLFGIFEMGQRTKEIPPSYLEGLVNDFKNTVTKLPNIKVVNDTPNN